MKSWQKGVSLIALIITIAILVIIAGTVIQKGFQRTDDAKLAKHNQNISLTQEEVESYYYYQGGNLPVVNLTPYPIPTGTSLEREVIKNGEQSDTFYTVDLSKLGKVSGKEGTTGGDDVYIVSSVRHAVYYAKGDTVKGITYHGISSKNDIKLATSYSYNNPKVPNGFTHIGTETWDNGFTIQDSNGNQFVWVPALDPRIQANGTLDGTTFNSKFGRRNFRGETFDSGNYYETIDANLQNIINSINKYGGFYIAKYETSQGTGSKAQSKGDVTPWANIDWNNSKAKAESMDTDWNWDTNSVESYLCYAANWDTTLQWLYNSGNRSLIEIKDNGIGWGNYYNVTFTYGAGLIKVLNTSTIINTGVITAPGNRHMAKGIYDLAGNVWEWTMESNNSSYCVYRGGCGGNDGNVYSAATRYPYYSTNTSTGLGFRVVLYIH